MVIVTDAKGVIEWVNPAFEHGTGYSLAEVVGRRPGDILQGPGTDPAAVRRMHLKLLAGEGFREAVVNYTKAGKPYFQTIEVNPVRDAQGVVVRYIGVQTDKTELPETVGAILATESRMQTLVASLPGIAYERTVAADGTETMEVFGPGLGELCGGANLDRTVDPAWFDALIHPADWPAVKAARRESARSLTMLSKTFRIRTPGGAVRWIKTRSAPRRLEDGAVRWTGLITDWTQQVAAESESLKLNEYLQVALRASKFGVWRHNLITGERDWDERMFDLYGLPRNTELPDLEEVLYSVHGDDRAQTRLFWAGLCEGKSGLELENRFFRRDGSLRHSRTHGVVLTWQDGRPEWVAGLQTDVTESVVAQERRERLEVQLGESRRLETLGTLAGGIAHDFNNLLTVIGGFAELARKELSSEHRARMALEETLRASRVAGDLVQQMLLFARRAPSEERRQVDVVALARETGRLVAASFPVEITLKLQLEAGVPVVLADASRLQQVIMNLCLNAGQAIGERAGSVTLAVKTVEFFSEEPLWDVGRPTVGRYVRFAVSDTGAGMSEAVRRRVFEPFFTTKEAGKGSGLGLSIVHGIVSELGGGIAVKAKEGEGATFEIFLPVTEVKPIGTQETAELSQRRGTGERVLVVDDDEVISYFAVEALKCMGYLPEAASGGGQALARFRNETESFSLLVVDYAMPGMTGVELIKAVRGLAPQVPVILISGDLGKADLKWLGELPRARTLQKPFTIDALTALAGELLGHGVSAGEGR